MPQLRYHQLVNYNCDVAVLQHRVQRHTLLELVMCRREPGMGLAQVHYMYNRLTYQLNICIHMSQHMHNIQL